jgi:hypothetical protein
MFAVDHAATALLIKRRFPSVSLTPMLVSVQAMELAWVGFNYLGLERTTTGTSVRSVADIHLAYMPFSHSVATACAGALVAWLFVEKGLGRPLLARAVGIGILVGAGADLDAPPRRPALRRERHRSCVVRRGRGCRCRRRRRGHVDPRVASHSDTAVERAALVRAGLA